LIVACDFDRGLVDDLFFDDLFYYFPFFVRGDPAQDVVVVPDVVNVEHRLPAPRVTVLDPRVPALPRQERQCLADVYPGVGVTALPFDDLASIEEMIEADVVSGERHPRPVGFGDAVGNPFHLARIELGTAENTALRIHAVFNVEVLGGRLRQHHDAAHSGRGYRVRTPVRFLVTDRGDQSPVNAMSIRRLLERLPVSRQAAVEMANEGTCPDVVELFRMAVVAVVHLCEQAFTTGADQVFVRAPQQAVAVFRAERPGDRSFDLQVESHPELRVEVTLYVEVR